MKTPTKYLAMIGRRGGARGTDAQKAAARRNGLRGGRKKNIIIPAAEKIIESSSVSTEKIVLDNHSGCGII